MKYLSVLFLSACCSFAGVAGRRKTAASSRGSKGGVVVLATEAALPTPVATPAALALAARSAAAQEVSSAPCAFAQRPMAAAPRLSASRSSSRRAGARQGSLMGRRAFPDLAAMDSVFEPLKLASDPAFSSAATAQLHAAFEELGEGIGALLQLLGPPQPAAAFDAQAAANDTWSKVANFFFDPRLQWDENGNILLDPQGNPLPDNLWTQFVAFQATLIKRLNEAFTAIGVPGSFGLAVACYTLLIRALLYPFVKGQLETTAQMQVLKPRVDELKKKYEGDNERLQQEVGLLYMDLQIDPLGAIVPLLLQLPVFWGLYRAIRRLAIVDYAPLKEGFLWIPSLYGPNFTPDPSFNWLTQWKGPLIDLHPVMGWETFGLYAIMPTAIFFAYRQILSEASEDKDSPKILQIFPFMLAFITTELPQAMGIYIAMNIASSVALTAYTKNQIASRIPGYDEFVKTGKWPPGVDPEKVLAKAFNVTRLSTGDGTDFDEPLTVPEAVFAGRADVIPKLLEEGRSIDEWDDRGIPATAYTLTFENGALLDRLFELGADPKKLDKNGNSLLHYCSGYGQSALLPKLLDRGLDSMLNHVNADGQTALDVARVNLQRERLADKVRPVINLLTERGAEGKTTSKESEAIFEEVREKAIREAEVKAARSALMALAAQTPAAEAASPEATAIDEKTEQAAEAAVEVEEKKEEQAKPLGAATGRIADSLSRIKTLDVEELKKRLGSKLSDEQLEKLAARLNTMSPEELAAYTASMKLPVQVQAVQAEGEESGADAAASHAEEAAPPKEQAASVPPAAPAKQEERRVSVIVD